MLPDFMLPALLLPTCSARGISARGLHFADAPFDGPFIVSMSTKGCRRRAACSVFGRLDLVCFEGLHSFKDVAVDIGAVGVFEGGADQGCPSGFDSLLLSMSS